MIKKIFVFSLCLLFVTPLFAQEKEGVIMLNSPEEIEKFRQMLEEKAKAMEAEKKPQPKSDLERALEADSSASGNIVLNSEDEIKQFSEAVSAAETPNIIEKSVVTEDDFEMEFQRYLNQYAEEDASDDSSVTPSKGPKKAPTYKYDKSRATENRRIIR